MKKIITVTISFLLLLNTVPVMANTISNTSVSLVASSGMVVPPSDAHKLAAGSTPAEAPQSQPGDAEQKDTALETSRGIGVSNVRTLLSKAMSLLGSKYVYGAEGPSTFDCSGFVRFVFKNAGVNLPHNAAAQYKYGKPVSKSELQPGDLVFFSYYGNKGINHSGIYIGNGKFIHASSSGKSVVITSLDSAYYKSNYQGARRITR